MGLGLGVAKLRGINFVAGFAVGGCFCFGVPEGHSLGCFGVCYSFRPFEYDEYRGENGRGPCVFDLHGGSIRRSFDYRCFLSKRNLGRLYSLYRGLFRFCFLANAVFDGKGVAFFGFLLQSEAFSRKKSFEVEGGIRPLSSFS